MATPENGSPGIMSYDKMMDTRMATQENGSPGTMSYNMYAPCKGNEEKKIQKRIIMLLWNCQGES